MKKILIISLIIGSGLLQAQTTDGSLSYEEKVSSIDSIISTLYKVISGDKGVERNWGLI
jgi:hypothetical protein